MIDKTNKTRTIIDTLIVLPFKMVDKIDEMFLTKKTKNHVFFFIYQLANSSHNNHKITSSAIPFSSKKFSNQFGTSYHYWLNPLLESNIVKRNDYYSKDKNKCMKYWINPIYCMHENFESDIQTKYVEVRFKLSVRKMTIKEIEFQKKVINDFSNLNYDQQKLYEVTKKHIDTISLSNYLIGENIIDKKFEVTYTDSNGVVQKKYMKREQALENSELHDEVLIHDKTNSKYYSAKLNEFICLKKTAIERYYTEAILKFISKDFYARRNKTNFRLDTNMTNCPSLIFEQIMRDNNLCQIDMSNAQFAIFVHNMNIKNLMIPNFDDIPLKKKISFQDNRDILMKKLESLLLSDDFKEFARITNNGTLYDVIKVNLNLNDRTIAKLAMFQLLFSSEKLRSELKEKLSNLFPTVVDYIHSYKTFFGYKNFSIGLQKKEAEIFIDKIYFKLKEVNIPTITRHDSIIVNFEHEQRAIEIIDNCFKTINFDCKLEREGHITERFYTLSKLKQANVKAGISGIVQEIHLTNNHSFEKNEALELAEAKDEIKKTRAPKKPTLKF